jgi:ferredoxin
MSYPNAVTAYPMFIGVKFFTTMAEINSKSVIKSIVAKQQRTFRGLKEPAKKRYDAFTAQIHDLDSGYHVNNDCISCGICRNVCPAKNITLVNGTPVFHHQCESCMACIQHCPKRAINYKNKTENRGRYAHPHIGHKVISQYYLR